MGSSLQQSPKLRVPQRTFRVAFYDRSMNYVSQCCAVAFAFSLLLAAPLRAQVEIELEGAVSTAEGNSIEMFDGLVRVLLEGAKFESEIDGVRTAADIQKGHFVELEATINPNGDIVASSVEVDDDGGDDAKIDGTVTSASHAEHSFSIGPVKFRWDDDTQIKGPSSPNVGDRIEVAVESARTHLRAIKIERDDD